jgi:hypothetical protein
MRWTRASSAVLVLGLLCSAKASQDAPPESAAPLVEKQGAHYVLRFHGGDEALAERALAAIEPVWPLVAEAFGAADAKPRAPLAVNLYRTVDGYVAADQGLTGGKFARNLAFSHHASRTAHVAVQPPCRDETLRAVGLPAQTITLLAWEAAHLARYELCPNFESHPDWLSDGLASWVARQAVAKAVPGAPEANPYWSSKMLRTQKLAEGRKLPPIESLLSDEVADLDFQDRYAARCELYAFLASGAQGPKLAKVLAEARRLGGGPQLAKQVDEQALAAFGSQDKAFAKFVAALRPEWDEVFRSLATSGNEWVQIAFPDTNAIAWRVEPLKAKSFSASGALRILPGDRQQLNFLFARGDQGSYSIAFVADSGFTVFDFRSATDEWVRIGDAKAPALRLGILSKFAVQAKKEELVVTLDDASWEFALPRPLPDAIVWGLGAQAGSAGIWSDVKVQK